MKIVELKYVPHPLALEAIQRAKAELEEARYIIPKEELSAIIGSSVIEGTQGYLKRFSKCPPERAKEAFEKLVEILGNEYEAAVMVNIKPRIPEEAADILRLLRRTAPDPEQARKVVEVLLQTCG